MDRLRQGRIHVCSTYLACFDFCKAFSSSHRGIDLQLMYRGILLFALLSSSATVTACTGAEHGSKAEDYCNNMIYLTAWSWVRLSRSLVQQGEEHWHRQRTLCQQVVRGADRRREHCQQHARHCPRHRPRCQVFPQSVRSHQRAHVYTSKNSVHSLRKISVRRRLSLEKTLNDLRWLSQSHKHTRLTPKTPPFNNKKKN